MWSTTLNRTEAMLYNKYIGEAPVRPKPIVNAVRVALGYRPLRAGLIFYYGERDEKLSKLFGYEE